MEQKERDFLEDTIGILDDYDGYKTVSQFKGLIDEAQSMIRAVLDGKIKEYNENL